MYLGNMLQIHTQNILRNSMREPALLFEPIVDIRDVLESFLVSEVLLSGWQRTLEAAAARLVELGNDWSDTDLVELGQVAEQLAAKSLVSEPVLARSAADDIARMLDQVRIPGVPRPQDEDWSF
jgi:hypothetical protein